MKLNNKLKAIAELSSDSSLLLDVGCDHALLDIYLAKKGVNCLGVDINQKPLEKALKTIKEYNLEDKITLKQCDGLSCLIDDVDTIVISGMGGILIKNIIEKDYEKINNQTIITCPNNDSNILRDYMCHHNYKIEKEILVKDKFIYEILVFKKGHEKYSKNEILYGKYFAKDELYYEYFNNKLNTFLAIKKSIPKKYFFKRMELNNKIKRLKNII